MKLKLTKKLVDGIEVTGKLYTVFDTETTGFVLRVGASGRKTFFFVYRAGKGRAATKEWVTLGAFPEMSVEQARALVKQKTAAVQNGQDPAAAVREEKQAITVSEALDAFQAEYVSKLKPSTVAFYKVVIDKHLRTATLGKIRGNLGKIRVKKLGYSEIARLHAAKKDIPYMANRCIAVLSVFLNWCEQHGYRDRHTNPSKEIKLYKEHKRLEFMGETELSIFGDTLTRMEATWLERQRTKGKRTAEDNGAITPQAAAAIRLLMFTGARRGEVLALRWDKIDLEKGIARLPDSKTGFKVLQLPAPAVALLEALPRTSEWVLPGDSASGHMVNIKDAWGDVLKQSGLSGWRLHDFRHAFASMMVNSGSSLPLIGKILGHKRASTTERYAHIAENPARKAAEAAAAKIAEAVATPPQRKIIRLRKVGNE